MRLLPPCAARENERLACWRRAGTLCRLSLGQHHQIDRHLHLPGAACGACCLGRGREREGWRAAAAEEEAP